jgi:hypothetical protein
MHVPICRFQAIKERECSLLFAETCLQEIRREMDTLRVKHLVRSAVCDTDGTAQVSARARTAGHVFLLIKILDVCVCTCDETNGCGVSRKLDSMRNLLLGSLCFPFSLQFCAWFACEETLRIHVQVQV